MAYPENEEEEEEGRGSSSSHSGIVTFKQPVVVEDADTDHLLLKNASLPAMENSSGTSGDSNVSSNRSDMSMMNAADEGEGVIDGSPDFEQFFKETATEAEDNAPAGQGKLNDDDHNDDDDDDDDMLGGVFAFSEEGKNKFIPYPIIF